VYYLGVLNVTSINMAIRFKNFIDKIFRTLW
jgi:hypothetical protein